MKSAGIALIFRLFLICLIFTSPVSPQELSPDVLLLARIKRHVEERSRRLANVSCLETVFREHQPQNGKMKPLDTVRLEVLTDGTKELYASPGDRKFSENPPIAWAGSGTLGNGFFGLYLRTVPVSGFVDGIASSNPRAVELSGAVVCRETIHFSDLPGVATFFFTGSRMDLREGFQTVWSTQRKTGYDRR